MTTKKSLAEEFGEFMRLHVNLDAIRPSERIKFAFAGGYKRGRAAAEAEAAEESRHRAYDLDLDGRTGDDER